MPIHEIKNPAPLPKRTEPPPKKADPVEKVAPLIRVRHLKREWQRRAYPAQDRELDESEARESLAALRQMIDKVNGDFERGKIAIHLSLSKAGESYNLEIYDCTNGTVCEILKGREIGPEELLTTLVKLQQETGLVIDTIS